ncbi:MAG: hypothetical protein QXT25_03030 [Candidatus Anstonellaceae archaeon]
MEMDERIVALFLVAVVLSSLYLHYKGTVADFELASKIKEGAKEPFHVAFASSLNQIIAPQPTAQDTIRLFGMLSPALFAASALMIFFAARKLGLQVQSAAFGTLMYAFSLVFVYFLPGTYSSISLASLFFAAFILLSACGEPLFYLSVLAAAAAVAVEPGFAIPGILFSAAQGINQKKLVFALPAAPFLAGALQAGFTYSAEGFLLAPFLAAASLVLFGGWHLLASGMVSLFIFPAAGAQILALQAAAAFESQKEDRRLGLASSFFAGYAALTGLFFYFGATLQTALSGSLFLALLFPLLLHAYEYRQKQYFLVFFFGLLVASLFTFGAYPLSGGKYYPDFADPELVEALSFLSGFNPQVVGLLGSQQAAQFFLPNATVIKQEKVRAYLEGKDELQKAYLVLSLSDFDKGAFEPQYTSYKFVGIFQSQYGEVAIFSSKAGFVARRLDANRQLAVLDGELLDAKGRFYGYLPLSRMHFLRNLSFDSEQNRMIVFEEDASYPRFFDIYSGEAAKKIAEFGGTAVFEVGRNA